ncbi:MAG: GHKL domain-containing protein [Oscillospiraceae bacterium]|nr:GHKL domain-containing protein [Oscillospiraceae bacterium]
MEKILIDIIGTGIGVFTFFYMFDAIWVRKRINQVFFTCIIAMIIFTSSLVTTIYQNNLILPIISILTTFSLSLFFISSVTMKLLITLVISAVMLAVEMIVGYIMVQVLLIPFEQIQLVLPIYMFGVFTTRLLALLIVMFLRMFIRGFRSNTAIHFNILMMLMPIQAIVLCYIVFVFSIREDLDHYTTLGSIAVFFSILLVFLTIYILHRQQKVMSYKEEHELNKSRLNLQLSHYQELYKEQQEIKLIRHEMFNNLTAIIGIIKAGEVNKAEQRLINICNDISKSSCVVYTGLPPVDAILNVKSAKARENKIDIMYSVIIDGVLKMDQFDLAAILANALDNAIEGILRSHDVERKIFLNISRTAEYIFILVENQTTGPVCEDFQTTKPDKKNHGYGMMQMKSISTKYNGSFLPSYDLENNKFTLKIMLKNQAL